MRYKRNFLSKVLMRLDFPTISKLLEDRKPQFSEEITSKYPFYSPKSTSQFTFTVAASGSAAKQENKGWLWEHRDVSGKKLVTLSPVVLIMDYDGPDEYKEFSPFKEDFTFLFNKLTGIYGIEKFTRLGLRYINEITFKEGKPLEWDGLINQSLITSVRAGLRSDIDMKVVRSMHQLHVKQDDVTILFNYGIFNPDFPNPVARRQFILDYDCFIASELNADEVVKQAIGLNKVAETMFESNIEEGLRSIMEVINE